MPHAYCVEVNLVTLGQRVADAGFKRRPVVRMDQFEAAGDGRRCLLEAEDMAQRVVPFAAPGTLVVLPDAEAGDRQRHLQAVLEPGVLGDAAIDLLRQPGLLAGLAVPRLLEFELRPDPG